MCDGIGCHENLETVEARDEMIVYVTTPNALLAFESFVNLFDYIGQKRACARSRIEYLDLVELFFDAFVSIFVASIATLRRFYLDGCLCGVCQTVGELEAGFEQMIYRAHYEMHHGFWRIPDAAGFFELLVVVAEKRLVKV